MRMYPYPHYKQTGIQWAKRIPESWQIKRLKLFSRTIVGGTPSTDVSSYWDGNIPWIPSGMLHGNVIDGDHISKFITLEGLNNSATKMIKRNSVLIALTGATCSNVAFLTIPASANQSVVGIEPDDTTNSKFLFYLLLSQREQILASQIGGAQASINLEDVRNILCVLPNYEEQSKISSFLEKKEKQINALVEKNNRLIRLLSEKRCALIDQVVTRGLHPDVELKDSGIPWIGKIPENAQVLPFRRICHLNQGLQYPESDRLYEQVPNSKVYITIKYIHAGDEGVREFIPNPPKSVTCKKEDVLLARTGATGEVETNQEGVFHNNFFKINYDSRIYRDYLVYYLKMNSVKELLLKKSGITTIPDLGHDSFLDTPFILHPKQEQIRIADYLDRQVSRIDEAKDKIQKRIELLEEYKKSLTNDVVTGKIDVREAEWT